jgi:hypothetical protein
MAMVIIVAAVLLVALWLAVAFVVARVVGHSFASGAGRRPQPAVRRRGEARDEAQVTSAARAGMR